MVVRVEVKGIEPTVRALAAFEESVRKITDREFEISVGRIIQDTHKYPSKLPGQKYVRTGTYGRSFTSQRIKEGESWLMTSNAVQKGRGYSPFVGGGETGEEQASIHWNRWPVFLDIAKNEAENTAERIETGLDEFAKSQGL